MVEEVFKFYENLFTLEDALGWEGKLEGILSTITEIINSRLIKPIEDSEIKKAMFSMNPNKAFVIDGMTPLFFEKFWHIIHENICNDVRNFFFGQVVY